MRLTRAIQVQLQLPILSSMQSLPYNSGTVNGYKNRRFSVGFIKQMDCLHYRLKSAAF